MSTKVFYDLRNMNNKVKFNFYIVSVVYLYYLKNDFDFYYFLFFFLLLLFYTLFINFVVKKLIFPQPTGPIYPVMCFWHLFLKCEATFLLT
jgi:hypothetical protein